MGRRLVQRGKQLAAVRRHQRVIVAQQFEHLQQGLVRQAFAVAAVADEQLEQTFQRRVVLLARQLLERATERDTPMGRLRVISVEGLIGFKLQGFTNDATRTRDLDDIRALLKIHRASLDRAELREYFALFNQLELFNELLA